MRDSDPHQHPSAPRPGLVLQTVLWLMGLAPWLWEAAFWLFAARATRALGHWPRPSLDDPKDLGFTVHYYGLLIGLPFAFAALLTLSLLLPFRRPLRRAGAALLGPWALALAGAVLLLALARLDPGGAAVWLAD